MSSNSRLDFFDANPAVAKFIKSVKERRPKTKELVEAITPMGKWTVPTVIKQLNTGKITLKFLSSVRDMLAQENNNLADFIKSNGFELLLPIPDATEIKGKNDHLKLSIVDMITMVALKPVGIKYLIENPIHLYRIGSWTDSQLDELKEMVYSLFAVLPFICEKGQVDASYRVIIDSFEYYCYAKTEARRFNHLINDLRNGKTEWRILSILFLINTVIHLPKKLDQRMALRYELNGLGLQDLISRMNEILETDDIYDFIQTYKEDVKDDEEEYKMIVDRAYKLPASDKQAFFDELELRLRGSVHLQTLYDEVLRRIALMPLDEKDGLQRWVLLERVVHHLTGEDANHTFGTSFTVGLLEKSHKGSAVKKEAQKLYADSTRKEHEIKKSLATLTALEEKVKELKKVQEQTKKAMSVDQVDASKVNLEKTKQEEIAMLETVIKGLQTNQINLLKEKMNLLHKERELAQKQIAAVDAKKREIYNMEQEWETNKMALRAELREDAEISKREALAEVKDMFDEDCAVIQQKIGQGYKKAVADLKEKYALEIQDIEEDHQVILNKALQEIRSDYEALLAVERKKNEKVMKEFEALLKERQSVISGKEKNLHEIKSQLAQVNRKLASAKTLAAQKEASKQEFLKSLNEQYQDTLRLSETQSSIHNKTILELEAMEKRITAEKEAIAKCNNDILEAQAKVERIKIIEETLEQKFLDETQMIKDLTKKVNDLDLIVAEKDKQIEALERDIKDLMDSTKVDPDNTTVVIKPEDLVKRAAVIPKGAPRGGPPPARGGPAPRGGPPPARGGPGGERGGPAARGGPAERGGPRGGPALPRGGPTARGGAAKPLGPVPSKKMKPFHWTKLRAGPVVTNSFFAEVKPGVSNVKVDMNELENLFCLVEKVKEDSVVVEKPKKVELITHVNSKVLQNVGIYLKQINNSKDVKAAMRHRNIDSLDLICESLLSLDSNILNIERIQMLMQAIIEESELKAIKDYLAEEGHYLNDLNEVDRYFYTTSKLPGFIARLKTWQFTLTYEEQHNSNLDEMLLVQKGISLVNKSKHFAKVLEIVLAIGNFMNFGTKTGNTVAFDIECLPKLIETRANAREQGNLLSFIINTMRTNYPETLTWTAELADLKYAKNASSDKIDLNMRELKANLTLARSLAANITKFNEKDRFEIIKEKIAKAEADFNEAQTLQNEINTSWLALAKAYGKDGSKLKPEAFFSLINEFASIFDKSIEEMEKNKRAAAKRAEKERLAKEEAERMKKDAAESIRKAAAAKTTTEDELKAGSQVDDLLSLAIDSSKSRSNLSTRRLEPRRGLEKGNRSVGGDAK